MPPIFSSRPFAVAAGLLGWCSAAALACGLSAGGLAHNLQSDALYPYAFCSELLHGEVPLSGWTISSAPYYFPDDAVLTGLIALCGQASGSAYGLYVVFVYLALMALAGLCARQVAGGGAPWVAALLAGHLLLALRALPGHDEYLFWIGIPGCHGGALLVGLAYFWLLGAAVRGGGGGRLAVPLFGVLLAGLISDTLFLFQFLAPAWAALCLLRRRHPGFVRTLRWQVALGLAAFVTSLGLKGIGRTAGWFDYGRMFRYALTPGRMWQAAGQFGADFSDKILPSGWGFLALLAAAGAWAAWSARKSSAAGEDAGNGRGAVRDLYWLACAVSLAVSLPLPILSCHWKNATCARYLLNWTVLPAFLLALTGAAWWQRAAPRGGWRRGAALAAAAVVFLGCLVVSVRGPGWDRLRLPYPADVAALDAFARDRGLHRGLGLYWNTCYADVLSRDGLKLRQVRANGEPYFWNSNASGYFARDARGRYVWPVYDYVVADLLDPAMLVRLFGEPQEREQVGRYTVWLYPDAESQRRIRATLQPLVEQQLRGSRLDDLRRHGLE